MRDEAVDAAQRERLAAAIRGLNHAHIETIHAFAASLLSGSIPNDIETAFAGTGRTLLPLSATVPFSAAPPLIIILSIEPAPRSRAQLNR